MAVVTLNAMSFFISKYLILSQSCSSATYLKTQHFYVKSDFLCAFGQKPQDRSRCGRALIVPQSVLTVILHIKAGQDTERVVEGL